MSVPVPLPSYWRNLFVVSLKPEGLNAIDRCCTAEAPSMATNEPLLAGHRNYYKVQK